MAESRDEVVEVIDRSVETEVGHSTEGANGIVRERSARVSLHKEAKGVAVGKVGVEVGEDGPGKGEEAGRSKEVEEDEVGGSCVEERWEGG